MAGVALAAFAGVAFGLFQVTNSRAGRNVDSYVGTFVVLAVSVVVLTTITLATQDLRVLRVAPVASFAWFAVAGGVHFFFGWTFLTLSQRKVGASRTGVLTGTAPLFGTLIAYVVLRETLRPVALVGVVLVVTGTLWLARARTGSPTSQRPPLVTLTLGLAAALCWGTSPVFIRWGLEGLPAPLVGVTIGMAAAAVGYGVALAARGRTGGARPPAANVSWLAGAGCVVALAIAAQWVALSVAPVAVVLALSQLAVPVVIVASPLVSRSPAEHLSLAGKLAAALIVSGSLVIILARSAGA